MHASMMSGPATRSTFLNPINQVSQRSGTPSGVTKPASLWMRRNDSSFWHIITR